MIATRCYEKAYDVGRFVAFVGKLHRFNIFASFSFIVHGGNVGIADRVFVGKAEVVFGTLFFGYFREICPFAWRNDVKLFGVGFARSAVENDVDCGVFAE